MRLALSVIRRSGNIQGALYRASDCGDVTVVLICLLHLEINHKTLSMTKIDDIYLFIYLFIRLIVYSFNHLFRDDKA